MSAVFDSATNGSFASGTSYTLAHTTSGTDRVLFVHVFINTSSDLITGVTYGGVPMTLVQKNSPASDRRHYVFKLINPTSGNNNIVVSSSSSTAIGASAISLNNAGQVTQPNVSLIGGGTTTPITTSVTTTVDDCVGLLFAIGNNADTAASTNSTLRASNTTYGDADIYQSTSAFAVAGSHSMTVTKIGGATPVSLIMLAVEPVGGGGGDTGDGDFMCLM